MYVIWKDTKVVTVTSTMHTATGNEKVIRKMKDKAGQLLRKEVKIPLPIVEYNKYKGGVDLSDQAISYYNILRKTQKYWRTLFWFFLDVMVTNSYLLYKLHLPEEECKKCTHKAFRDNLVTWLCDLRDGSEKTLSPSHRVLGILTSLHTLLVKSDNIVICAKY